MTSNARGDVEQKEISFIAGGNLNDTAIFKIGWQFLTNLNMVSLYDLALFVGIYQMS